MFGLFKKKSKTTFPSSPIKYRLIEKTFEARQKARDISLTLVTGETVTYTSKSELHSNPYRVNLVTGKSNYFDVTGVPLEYVFGTLGMPWHFDPPVPALAQRMLQIPDQSGTQRLVNMQHVVIIDAKPIYETEEILKEIYAEVEKIPEKLE